MRNLTPLIILLLFAATTVAQQKEQPAKKRFLPMLKDGSVAAYVRFGRPKITHGVSMRNPEGSTYATEAVKGFLGVLPARDSVDNGLYFRMATDRLVKATGTFYVTIQYFDQGQRAVELDYHHYAGDESLGTKTKRFFLGNTGKWQRHTFPLEQTAFNRALPGDSDFRIRCPGVPLRQVAVARVPLTDTMQRVSPFFNQPRVNPPPGFAIGVFPRESEEERFWENDELITDKARLYRAWGAEYVVDTVGLQKKRGHFDFSQYKTRRERLALENLQWVPRFKIGDTRYIHTALASQLQQAIGTERAAQGPMVSLWEPQLARIYQQAFIDMQRYRLHDVPMVILSLAGDWGPLYLSSELNSNTGWPDYWGGDPIALRDFRSTLRRQFGSVTKLNRAWETNYNSWNEITPRIASDQAPMRNVYTLKWYHLALNRLAEDLMAAAKRVFHNTKIVIELTGSEQQGATDVSRLTRLASQLDCSLLQITDHKTPTQTADWQWLSSSARRNGVPFGLRILGGGREVLGAIHALASEQGSMLFFQEETMAGKNTWAVYKQTIKDVRLQKPQNRVAVVYPKTSILAGSPLEFERIVNGLRERFSFDLIDEEELSFLSPDTYPILMCPWGHFWSDEALAALNKLVWSGAALIVGTDEPWQTLLGDRTMNQELFFVELQRNGDDWNFVPRRDSQTPYDKASPPPERQAINLGSTMAGAYLSGRWSEPSGAGVAKQLGFDFPAFRWLGNRGKIAFPIQPGKDYKLEIEGFLPKGKDFTVFMNKELLGKIRGDGQFKWNRLIRGNMRPKTPRVELLLQGETWKTGEVLNATQTMRVGMAVSRVAMFPPDEPSRQTEGKAKETEMAFDRGSLRESWMREVGQGITVLAPTRFVSSWVFEDMVADIVANPMMLDVHYKFNQPPDGERNQTFVTPFTGAALYMNFNSRPKTVSKREGERTIRFTIPPRKLYYVPYRY